MKISPVNSQAAYPKLPAPLGGKSMEPSQKIHSLFQAWRPTFDKIITAAPSIPISSLQDAKAFWGQWTEKKWISSNKN
jgi:hypothetical protein